MWDKSDNAAFRKLVMLQVMRIKGVTFITYSKLDGVWQQHRVLFCAPDAWHTYTPWRKETNIILFSSNFRGIKQSTRTRRLLKQSTSDLFCWCCICHLLFQWYCNTIGRETCFSILLLRKQDWKDQTTPRTTKLRIRLMSQSFDVGACWIDRAWPLYILSHLYSLQNRRYLATQFRFIFDVTWPCLLPQLSS